MKFVKSKELKVLALFALSSVLIVSFSLVLPITAAVAYDAFWASVWVAITHSGSTLGVIVVLLCAALLISLEARSLKKGIVQGVVVFLLLSVPVGVTAFFNENVIKERLKEFRPSILYLEERTDINAKEFYSKEDKVNRSNYLKKNLNLDDGHSLYVDDKPLHDAVLKEWIRSAGYSFPSGHSVSAFLVVTLLGYYVLLRFKPQMAIGEKKRRSKHLWLLSAFYLWAILVAYSRVLIGVHSAWDISLGALWGSMVAFILIYSGLLNKLWPNRTKKAK